jgi:hypothetical protein
MHQGEGVDARHFSLSLKWLRGDGRELFQLSALHGHSRTAAQAAQDVLVANRSAFATSRRFGRVNSLECADLSALWHLQSNPKRPETAKRKSVGDRQKATTNKAATGRRTPKAMLYSRFISGALNPTLWLNSLLD